MALRSVYNLIDKYGAARSLERNLAGPSSSSIVEDREVPHYLSDGTPAFIPLVAFVATATVPMMERRSDESPMVGDVSQYNLQFYVKHDSLSGAGFPVPPIKGDRVHDSNNRVYTIRSVEDMHDQNGAVGGYRMWVRGH